MSVKSSRAESGSEVVKSSSYGQKRTAVGHRAWAIKLGSGGIYIDFCEKHQIIGIGWVGVSSTGQIFNFVQECAIGDYVIYYDPRRKRVRICRVISEAQYRNFELNNSQIDIWHYRRVEYPVPPISIVDFYGGLKSRLLDPRMFFWELPGAFQTVDNMTRSSVPQLTAADSEIIQAYAVLRDLLVTRAEALDQDDWESIVVDYLKAQGASVDEQNLNNSTAIEARFDHGGLGEEVWRVRVKRTERYKVDWPAIEYELKLAGNARLCFVSVFGFTDHAHQSAYKRGVRLMQAADFSLFFLTGKVRETIREKLHLPVL